MFWLPVIGLIGGIAIGSVFTFTVPVLYAKYLSVAVLAGLDSLLGSVRGCWKTPITARC